MIELYEMCLIQLTWIEFKRFMEEAMGKMERLREFLKEF